MSTVREVTRERGHCYRIRLDDGTEISLDKEVWEAAALSVGDRVEPERLAALEADSRRRRARSYALYLLGVRDYSGADLSRKLRDKWHGEAAAETVAWLREQGLLQDAVYAERLARDCRLRKLYGRARVLQELQQHGIDRDTAAAVLDRVDAEENLTETQQALALLQKKRYNGCGDEAERQRGFALLVRYGYGFSEIRQAWNLLKDTT